MVDASAYRQEGKGFPEVFALRMPNEALSNFDSSWVRCRYLHIHSTLSGFLVVIILISGLLLETFVTSSFHGTIIDTDNRWIDISFVLVVQATP